jgi:hypothetical protein
VRGWEKLQELDARPVVPEVTGAEEVLVVVEEGDVEDEVVGEGVMGAEVVWLAGSRVLVGVEVG